MNTSHSLLSEYYNLFTMAHQVTFGGPKQVIRLPQIPTKFADLLESSHEISQSSLRRLIPPSKMHWPKKPDK